MTGGGGEDAEFKEEMEKLKAETAPEEKVEKKQETIKEQPKKAEPEVEKKPAKAIKKPVLVKAEQKKKPKKQEIKKDVLPLPATEKPETAGVAGNKKMSVNEIEYELDANAGRQALRRSGIEIKKAEELQEKKKIEQEKEWEIPAFLRRVKYNK